MAGHGGQRGLGAVAAVLVLVMLSSLAAAVVRLGWTEQVSFGQDIQSARAGQAASAGVQWGLFQVLKGSWTACGTATQTLDLRSETGALVTVTCSQTPYSEGESAEATPQDVNLFVITAVACNGTTACPDNTKVGSPGYVERSKQVQVTDR